MSLAREIRRGFFLKARFEVNGSQKASRSLGTSARGAAADMDGSSMGRCVEHCRRRGAKSSCSRVHAVLNRERMNTSETPIGQRLRKLRQGAGLSQRELARRARVSNGAIS